MKLLPVKFLPLLKVIALKIIFLSQVLSTIADDGSQYCLSSASKCIPSKLDSSESLEPGVYSGTGKESTDGIGANMTLSVILTMLQNSIAFSAGVFQSSLFKHLSALVLPALYGLLMVLFSWLLVYYDSKIPGVYPPTPVSPKKHRLKSGHTFHLGYTIGLINGIMVFGLSLWQQIFH